jgi:Subtilase family
MVNGMKAADPYNAKPPAINLNYSFDSSIPAPEDSARTGKDIYGRLVGFPMEDHGLAIAGIIRDLAPDANIECLRVLNDYGVGDLRTLISALNYIYNLSQSNGSLILPVVVNLSLVLFPPEHDLHDGSLPNIEDIIATSRSILRSILNHDSFEAIFLCSVGNDCDTRDTAMNPTEVRFMARYPAAFADDKEHRIDRIIPVGAVNKERKAASYSNYPGNNGVATYGGELPKPDPWLPSALSGISRTHVDDTVPVDALCGIYTAKEYPALSVNDDGRRTRNAQRGDVSQEEAEHYPMYHVPNLRAWAYWSGTSYATPIISALAARVLEVARVDGVKENIPQVIRDLAQQRRKLWKRVIEYRAGEKLQAMNGSSEMSEPKDLDGKVILAVQDWLPEINE